MKSTHTKTWLTLISMIFILGFLSQPGLAEDKNNYPELEAQFWQAIEQNDFKKGASAYQQLTQSGFSSLTLHQKLFEFSQKNKKPGWARFACEKALYWDARIQLFNQCKTYFKNQNLEFGDAFWQKLSPYFALISQKNSWWLWLSLIVFAGLGFFIVLFTLLTRRFFIFWQKIKKLFLFTYLVLGFYLIFCLVLLFLKNKDYQNQAIVLEKLAVYQSPVFEEPLIELKPGKKIKILQNQKEKTLESENINLPGFVKITFDNQLGWINTPNLISPLID